MKRTFCILLSLALALTGAAGLCVSAQATDTDKAIRLVPDGVLDSVAGAQGSSVYFGAYKQSVGEGYSDTNLIYNVDPIKWRVLQNADGKLFLLSDQNLDVQQYHKSNAEVTWETCDLREWLNSRENPANGRFAANAFTGEEWASIADSELVNANNPVHGTSGGNNTTDKVFALSIAEVTNTAYGFSDNPETEDEARRSTNTAFTADGGQSNHNGMNGAGAADYWWLRTPGDTSKRAALILSAGNVRAWGIWEDTNSVAVRPALNVDLDRILFASPAEGDTEDGLSQVGGYTGNAWKLTVLDDSRSDFRAYLDSEDGNTWTIRYSGARSGNGEWICAMIVNGDGEATYYGKLCAADTGENTITIDVSGKFGDSDTLYVFNVLANGNKKTDYASAMQTIKAPHIHSYNEPVWKWADDFSSANATFTCVANDDTQVVPAQITTNAISAQSCTTDEIVTYTASATFDGTEYKDTTDEITLSTAYGHSYGGPVWQWDPYYTGASATFTCGTCSSETTVDATNITMTVVSEEDCSNDRVVRYTATVPFAGTSYSDTTDDVTIPGSSAYGSHDYGDAEWTWAADYSSATATFRCIRCEEAPVIQAAVDAIVVSAEDCLHDRVVQYTATVAFAGRSWSDTSPEITIADTALGHDWGEWETVRPAAPGQAGEMKRVCERCGEVETAAIDELILHASAGGATGSLITVTVPYAKRGALATSLTADTPVTYTTSDPKLLSVDEDGNVTFVRLCIFCKSATITAADADGNTAACSVKIDVKWWQYIVWLFLGSLWF